MLRILKGLTICSIAIFLTLVVISNIVDYSSSLTAVIHVLSMDTTFQSPSIIGRAITDPNIQTILYLLIIAIELLAGLFLWIAGLGMLIYQKSETRFTRCKHLANIGLFLGFGLYFLGFIAIGGEWFSMWQSKTWNATADAAIYASLFMLVLIFMNQD